jgi:murein DD-endopeptidase MepM/ murein hydrolase activator NlpD
LLFPQLGERVAVTKEKDFLTIILVPSAKSKLHKIKIPYKYLYAGLVAGLFVVFITAYLFFRFISLSIENDRLDTLVQENSHLIRTNTQMQNELDSIMERVNSLETWKKKIYRMLDITPSEFGVGNIVDASNIDRYYPEAMIEKLNYTTGLLDKDFKQIEPKVKEQVARLASIPSIWPAYGYITSWMGYRIDPFTKKRTFHKGVDIVGQLGTPIIAPADGIIIRTQEVNESNRRMGFGNAVYIEHRFGYITKYAHLSRIAVKKFQKVKRGDVIGYMGNTGRSVSTHLHYEVLYNSVNVNPYDYMLDEPSL